MTTVDATDNQQQLVLAAREALDKFEALASCELREPRLATDQRRWLTWHYDSHQPARRAWAKAIDDLELLPGDDFPGRENTAWKPVCVRILSGEWR